MDGRRKLPAIASMLVLLSACGDVTAPIDLIDLPDPDQSLDPERVVVGEYIATPCAFSSRGGGLPDLEARDDWAVVDIFFGRTSPEGPWDGPTQADLALVNAHGGEVVHQFHVPAVRAVMVLSRIPGLVQDGDWVTVRDVPDATRYDVDLMVGFSRPLEASDDELIRDLGGREVSRIESISALGLHFPDRMIPELRAHPDVEYVELNGVFCLD